MKHETFGNINYHTDISGNVEFGIRANSDKTLMTQNQDAPSCELRMWYVQHNTQDFKAGLGSWVLGLGF